MPCKNREILLREEVVHQTFAAKEKKRKSYGIHGWRIHMIELIRHVKEKNAKTGIFYKEKLYTKLLQQRKREGNLMAFMDGEYT